MKSILTAVRRLPRVHFFIVPTLLFSTYLIFSFAPAPKEICCDATGYMEMAQSITENGLFAEHRHSHIRTYLYPFLLSLEPEGTAGYTPAFVYAHSSTMIYLYLTVALLSWCILTLTGTPASPLLWFALFANPLLLTYLPLSLTESHTLLIFSLIICIAVPFVYRYRSGPDNLPSRASAVLIVCLLGLLSGASVVIRPSSIALACSIIAVLLFYVVYYAKVEKYDSRRRKVSRRISLCISVSVAFGLGFSVAVAPQVVINVKHFEKVSFFPARDLGNAQLFWGLENFKYATLHEESLRRDGQSRKLFYPTRLPFPSAVEYSRKPLEYYIDHPIYGAGLFLIHVYQSLNYDFSKAYISQSDYPVFSWHQLLSSFLTAAGLLGIVFRLKRFRSEVLNRPEVLFLLVCLVANSMLIGMTAVETRFGIISLGALTYFSLYFLSHDFMRITSRKRFISIFLVLAYVAASVWVSLWFVRGLKIFTIVWV